MNNGFGDYSTHNSYLLIILKFLNSLCSRFSSLFVINFYIFLIVISSLNFLIPFLTARSISSDSEISSLSRDLNFLSETSLKIFRDYPKINWSGYSLNSVLYERWPALRQNLTFLNLIFYDA